ncbi:cupin domain-containing protein [Halopenitus sp. H-Gu1]|uniref:cupin domain-containing protein n=1 Tax=Halopenitus sp. H-Gu1 TaxID=3242697 RepID=UPI00359CE221
MPDPGWAHWTDLPVDESFEYGERYGVSDALDSEQMRCSVITFSPGERGPLHSHTDPQEEYYFVLEGTLDITVGGDVVEANEGTIIYTPPETEHFPENNTDEDAILLTVSSPRIPPTDGITVIEDVSTDN